MKKQILFIFFLLSLFFLNSQEKNLKISGSSTIQPFVEKISDLYNKKYKALSFVEGGGSGMGVKDVIAGISDIGMVSRSLHEDEKKQLKYTTIAYDSLVFIVNINNPLDSVNLKDIQEIYTGKVKTWKNYINYDKDIILVNQEIGRATLELFEQYSGVFHYKRGKAGTFGIIDSSAFEISSELEMATIVGGIPNAIGYTSYGTALYLISLGMPIKILKLDGIMPTKESILSRKYPIVRELNLVYKDINVNIQNFINLFFSKEGLEIIKKMNYIEPTIEK